MAVFPRYERPLLGHGGKQKEPQLIRLFFCGLFDSDLALVAVPAFEPTLHHLDFA